MIAVVGAGRDVPRDVLAMAEAAGRAVARAGAALVCGGRGGVMEAAARGARRAGGHTIGILPGYDAADANPWIEFVIASGLGEARNAVVVGAADAVIAFAGEGGTLAEIGFALKLRRPIAAVRAWRELSGVEHVDAAEEAVERVVRRLRSES